MNKTYYTTETIYKNEWICKFCKKPIKNHHHYNWGDDRREEEYSICNCSGAKLIGLSIKELDNKYRQYQFVTPLDRPYNWHLKKINKRTGGEQMKFDMAIKLVEQEYILTPRKSTVS